LIHFSDQTSGQSGQRMNAREANRLHFSGAFVVEHRS
jgi:hypothetical protein